MHRSVARADKTPPAPEPPAPTSDPAAERLLAQTRASEDRLRTILQTALDGFFAIDMEQRLVDVNEAYCAMSGYSREEILAMRLADVVISERPEAITARILGIVEHGSGRFESRHRRKDGSTIEVELSVTHIPGGRGELVCFCRDITASKRAAHDLSRQLRYAEALARCSQRLLLPALSRAEHQAHLEFALNTLRASVGVSRLYIYQPPADVGGLILPILADAHAPGLPPYIEPTPEEILDVPRAMLDALYAGRTFGGLTPGRFTANPHFQRSLDKNNAQSILFIPVFVGGALWGVLSAVDRVGPREWDTSTEQLLRTAAEMIATFQQGWESAQALREQEHFIQRVMEASPDLIHVVELATRRSIFLNRSLAPLLGYPAAHVAPLAPETMSQLIHPEDLARMQAYYDAMGSAADGQVAEIEYRVRVGDGGERWARSRDLVFARDAAGRATQILSIAQDITESKRTAQALASSEARLRALRDALPDILFVIGADGTFLEFHMPRQSDLLVSPETFIGRRIVEVLPPDGAAAAMAAIERVRASGEMQLFEDAATFSRLGLEFEVRVVPISDEELLFVVRDITAQHQATRALLQAKEAAEAADRAKSTFLAHVSHEIRTPLTAIIGMTGLLRGSVLSPQQREHLSTIRTAAETLLTIIGNILDFSKIEAGQIELDAAPFDLRACLSEALDLVALDARRKGLALSCVVDPAVPAGLSGDRGRLRQVLLNLLGNAVKFTEHGEVALMVGGRPQGEAGFELELRISDTGIGIAAEHLSQIFKPFVQADNATTRRYGGTGLGLTISRQLIERMGGRIEATSAACRGAIFTIQLPLPIAEPPPTSQHAALATPDAPAQAQLRVLLAEDNRVNQQVLSRLLVSLGHRTDVVEDGVAALAAVAREAYDVVLMDIQMPELDGEAATRRIRAFGPGITQPHIIALTASALRGDRERYLAAGMNDYLSKPVQIEDLQSALGRVPRPESAPPPDLIDRAMLRNMLGSVGGSPAQVAELVLDLFRGTLATQIDDAAGAVAADDRSRVRLLAHKLRGGSHQLGAARLAECWQTLEDAAQAPGAALAPPFAEARQTYDDTLAQLSAWLDSPPDEKDLSAARS